MNESNRIESNRIESKRIDARTPPPRLERRTTTHPSRTSSRSTSRARRSPTNRARRSPVESHHSSTHDSTNTDDAPIDTSHHTHHTHIPFTRLQYDERTYITHTHTHTRLSLSPHGDRGTPRTHDRRVASHHPSRTPPPLDASTPRSSLDRVVRRRLVSMSVVGFDFGSANNVVALARRKGIDVVLNDESKRETPCMVNFGEKQVRDDETRREAMTMTTDGTR